MLKLFQYLFQFAKKIMKQVQDDDFILKQQMFHCQSIINQLFQRINTDS